MHYFPARKLHDASHSALQRKVLLISLLNRAQVLYFSSHFCTISTWLTDCFFYNIIRSAKMTQDSIWRTQIYSASPHTAVHLLLVVSERKFSIAIEGMAREWTYGQNPFPFIRNSVLSAVIFQNYWVSGLCPSSGILETRKHNVSETGSVPHLTWGRKQIQFPNVEFSSF
jgi:hypothetical protein